MSSSETTLYEVVKCGKNSSDTEKTPNNRHSLRHTVTCPVCRKLSRLLGIFSVSEEFLQQSTTSSSVVSDDDMHKLPASRDERADGGHGSESLR